MARGGIGVLWSAAFGSETAAWLSASITRTSVLSGFVLSGAGSALSTNDPFWFKDINGWLGSCDAICSSSLEGITTFLISEGGFTSSVITQCWSASKETEELLCCEAPILAATFLCFCSHAYSQSLFSAASLIAHLRGEGVESLEVSTGTFLIFLLPFLLYSGSSLHSEASAYGSGCYWGIGSLITIPPLSKSGGSDCKSMGSNSIHRLCSNGKILIFCIRGGGALFSFQQSSLVDSLFFRDRGAISFTSFLLFLYCFIRRFRLSLLTNIFISLDRGIFLLLFFLFLFLFPFLLLSLLLLVLRL